MSTAPIWVHAACLAAALFALVPVVGTSSSLMSDEGVVMLQAEALHDDGTWAVPNPSPDVDPEGRWFPLRAVPTASGWVAYGKHPAYPSLLAQVTGVGGAAAYTALSVLGTVAAAVLAALLARTSGVGSERTVLWVTGVGSPLLFDSFLVIAHTVAAALATAALLVTVRRRWRTAIAAAAVVTATFVLGLLRSEGIVFGVALAGGAGLLGVARRDGRLAACGVAALGGVGAARLVETAWQDGIVDDLGPVGRGLPVFTTSLDVSGNVLGERARGALNTLLRPSEGLEPAAAGLAMVAVVSLVLAVVLARRRVDGDRPMIRVLLATAAVAATARWLVTPELIRGLLVAFPLVPAACAVARGRRDIGGDVTLVLFVVGLTVAGVLASQYAVGGTVEWGGRYLAVAVPAMVVVAVHVGRRGLGALDRPVAREAAIGLALVTAVWAVTAVSVLRTRHGQSEGLAAAVGDLPGYTVATDDWVPEYLWPSFDETSWLAVPPDELDVAGDRLAAAGVGSFVLVTRERARDEQSLAARYEVEGVRRPPNHLGIEVVTLARRDR